MNFTEHEQTNKEKMMEEQIKFLHEKMDHLRFTQEIQANMIRDIWNRGKKVKPGILMGSIEIIKSFFTGKPITYSIK